MPPVNESPILPFLTFHHQAQDCWTISTSRIRPMTVGRTSCCAGGRVRRIRPGRGSAPVRHAGTSWEPLCFARVTNYRHTLVTLTRTRTHTQNFMGAFVLCKGNYRHTGLTHPLSSTYNNIIISER